MNPDSQATTARADIEAGRMTYAYWQSLPRAVREVARIPESQPQLDHLIGWRVEVVDSEGDKPRRFNVGRSTGWRPCLLEVHNARSSGGPKVSSQYHSVRAIRPAARWLVNP